MLKATKEELEVLKAAQLVLKRLGKDELQPHCGVYNVHQLAKDALEETIKGNGEKKIFITSDVEGNSYHELLYLLDTNPKELESLRMDSYCFDNVENEEIALLG